MTVPALDVLREFTGCPYVDAVDAPNHSGCSWCAKREEVGVDVALADLDALVQAARDVSETERTGVLPDFQPLADALARVTGEAR